MTCNRKKPSSGYTQSSKGKNVEDEGKTKSKLCSQWLDGPKEYPLHLLVVGQRGTISISVEQCDATWQHCIDGIKDLLKLKETNYIASILGDQSQDSFPKPKSQDKS